MAAYKRPTTVEVRKGATERMPHHKTVHQFLSPFSYDQIHKKLRKSQEHEEQLHKP